MDMEKEVSILRELQEKKIPAPKLFYTGKKHIILEYLKGQLFLNFFENLEMAASSGKESWDASCRAAFFLAHWFKRFYKTAENHFGQTVILYDVNLRNFILKDDMVYGFDFEDCRPGKKETDTGRLCAYFLTYAPAFTPWKKELAQEIFQIFTRHLGLNRLMVNEEMSKELKAISRRRRIIYQDSIEELKA